MRYRAVSLLVAAAALGGAAVPVAAAAHAAGHSSAKPTVQNGPCRGFGLDIALGSINRCVPL